MTDSSSLKSGRGLRRLIKAVGYSCAGLRAAWTHEAAFRQEALAALVLVPLALWLPLGALEKLCLIGSVVLVLVVEILNSALEAAIDRDSLEINALGKRAKDLGSAAVMLALLWCVITWAVLLGVHFSAVKS